MIQIAIQCKINPSLSSEHEPASWRARLVSLKGLIAILIGFLLVMGGLMTGLVHASGSRCSGHDRSDCWSACPIDS